MEELLTYLEEIMKNEMVMEFTAMYFWLGFIFYMVFDIIETGINNIKYNVCLIKDYERIIACNINPLDIENTEDKELIYGAINNYEKPIMKRKSIFKKLFKKKK